MTADEFNRRRNEVYKSSPLIHCITNPISINQCANALLAVGARPIMAEHPDEVCEITSSASAVLLNLGNITDARLLSIEASAKCADENSVPYIIDMVGAACSALRRNFAEKLIYTRHPAVIKGNYSEIRAMYDSEYSCSGVDADKSIDVISAAAASAGLSKQCGAVVLASGREDIVTDGESVLRIKCGTPRLASVTGTGCMLGALCAAYLSVCGGLSAAAYACVHLGICGEASDGAAGGGSFMSELIDSLSCLSDKDYEKGFRITIQKAEDL